MKLCRLIPILLLAFCSVLPLCAQRRPDDGIVVVVNDAAITVSQVDEFAAPAIESLRRRYANDPVSFDRSFNGVITNGVELLLERQLILHDFDVEGYRLPESAVDQMVQERIRDLYGGDRVTLMKSLQTDGVTFEQFRQDVRDRYIESALRQKNVSPDIIISPFQVETFYNAHFSDFKIGDEIKLRMIELNKESADDTNTVVRVREIRDRIKDVASFAQMAREYSQDSLRNQGGDRGWVERSTLRKDLADAAFELPIGQVSDVVDTPDACFLLFVEDKHPAHIKPLKEVRLDIERTLRAQKQSLLQTKWIGRLKSKTFIRYF
jgi:peptidyl-prolyl cis-trans isomerase SurA